MTRNIHGVLFALIMIAVVVSVDLLFFRNHFWERLIANIGIVLVFAAFYLRFLKNLELGLEHWASYWQSSKSDFLAVVLKGRMLPGKEFQENQYGYLQAKNCRQSTPFPRSPLVQICDPAQRWDDAQVPLLFQTLRSIPDKIHNLERNKPMINPPDLYPNPGSYEDVLKRMTRRMKQDGIDERILEILQQAFEKELQHRIILSRPERKRLFQQVSRAILADVLAKIGDPK